MFSLPSFPKKLSPSFLAGLLAGLAFALHPADTRRVTITIYFLTRTLEFCYNLLDDKGYFPRDKPWWFGSWLIFPISSAQLLHAFVFDRDCFPKVCNPLDWAKDRDTAISFLNIHLLTFLKDRLDYHPLSPGQIVIKSLIPL